MTGKWRLDGRGWAIALALTLLTAGLLALGAAIPALASVSHALLGLIVVLVVILAARSRAREFGQYDLRDPAECDDD